MGMMNKLKNFIYKTNETPNKHDETPDYENKKISKSLDDNLKYIQTKLGNSSDLVSRDFFLDSKNKTQKVCFIYINGMGDHTYINANLLQRINENFKSYYDYHTDNKNLVEVFMDYILTISEILETDKYSDLFIELLNGETILLLDDYNKFIIFGSRKYSERAITEPTTHMSVKGPKDSFTESLQNNISLIRRRLKNPNLWVKKFIMGKKTNTDVVMVYLKGTADESLVNEVEKRLKAVELENIMDSSYINAVIHDKNFCVFPTMYDNERPDVITANILEGRVAIIVDGTPFVMIAPAIFPQFIQTVEDFHHKSYVATFFRFLRMIAFYISIFLPSLYVTLVKMHSELIPFSLLIQISAQRQGIPFPTYIEMILLGFTYDILREAGIRMPKALGSAMSVVGALVLGEAAVQSGLFSPIMVIVVSTTAISTLVIPNYNLQLAVSVLRYAFIFLAVGFGLYGVTIGIIMLFTHLCSVRSFGVSYYTPNAPFNLKGQMDNIYRAPIKNLFKKHKNISKKFPY